MVLLKANITSYVLNISRSNATEYLVCVRLWHRVRGQDRKLDDGCIRSRAPGADSSTNHMVVIFAVVVAVNVTLIVTLVAVKMVRLGKTRATGNFAIRKWWTDLTDLLQAGGRSDLSGRSSVTTNSGEIKKSEDIF